MGKNLSDYRSKSLFRKGQRTAGIIRKKNAKHKKVLRVKKDFIFVNYSEEAEFTRSPEGPETDASAAQAGTSAEMKFSLSTDD